MRLYPLSQRKVYKLFSQRRNGVSSSFESQQKLEGWDKMMGMKRCHNRTMAKRSCWSRYGHEGTERDEKKTNEGKVISDATSKISAAAGNASCISNQ